jgi:general secretion pathway protein G
MTLIEIMIVLAIIALVMGILVGPAILSQWTKARRDTSRVMTTQIASAWARWRLSSTRDCPESVDELREELGRRRDERIVDAWGAPYVIKCGDERPDDCDDFCVLSKGPDGKEGTADDITNWAPRAH